MNAEEPQPKEDGYVIYRSIFSSDEIEALRNEANRLAQATGKPCVRDLFSRSKALREIALDRRLLTKVAPGLHPVRGILFDKTPVANWPVGWHRDLTIAVENTTNVPGYGPWTVKDGIPHVQPPVALLETMRTARIHLDETAADNGALRVLPNSHYGAHLSATTANPAPEIVCECSPGDVLIMSPLLLHASSRASSPSRRRILHFEYAPLSSLHPDLKWHDATTECST